jgi:hypothetical protein
MPAPSTPEARNLHREVQALIEQEAVQQVESSASHICHQTNTRDDGGAQGQEASVHAGGAAGKTINQGRMPVRERILDAQGTPRICGHAPRSPASRSGTSYSASPSTVLSSRASQSEIIHAFLEGTTYRDLVRELGRSPQVDSNELFDIATSFASEEEVVGAIFDG